MNAKTKIKVDRIQLIEAIEAKRDAAVAAHARSVEEYRVAAEEVRQGIIDALRETALAVEAGGALPDLSYDGYGSGREWYVKAYVPFALPSEPRPEPSTAGFTRSIAQLRMGTDESIAISVDDFAAYVG